jgi:Large polyvalent protein associated domain 29
MTAAERKTLGDNIRNTLKTAFPSIKFSVRVLRHGYWGTTFGVRWADGPSEEEVWMIADVSKTPGVNICYDREDEESAAIKMQIAAATRAWS